MDGRNRSRGPKTRGPIGQFFHPVHHSDDDFLAANRTAIIVFPALPGRETDPAAPVAVKVIFSFFRKKFNGGRKAGRVFLLNGFDDGRVGKLGFKNVGLSSDFGGRVGIGIGN